jgi:MFS family permease
MSRPTAVRYRVLVATTLVALFMYVDRACLGQVATDIQRELNLEPWQMDVANGAFFWSYAVAQVAAATAALRFGLRHTFALCLFLWSAFTVLTGLSTGFLVLLASRLLVGLSEAGAYPIAATLVKNWFPPHRRGFASGVVAFGGRFGGALSLLLTPILVVAFAAYPKEVHGAIAGGPGMIPYDPAASGWRLTLTMFGLLGMGYAVVYWFVARDRAADHPRANAAEIALVPPPPPASAEPFPWRAILTNRSLWLNSLAQFCINIGWAFIITKLGEYLEKGHGLTGGEKGFWSSLPLFLGIPGMFVGGFVTDAMTRRFGQRWGRALPIGAALFVCTAAATVCAATTDFRLVVAMWCVIAAAVDVGVPAIWAFAQDIGGRHTGAALGWANMWGNFGAGLCPVLLGWVQRTFTDLAGPDVGWQAMFVTCAGAFSLAAVAGCELDSTKTLGKK